MRAKLLSAALCVWLLLLLQKPTASQDPDKPGRDDDKLLQKQADDGGQCNCEAVTCRETVTEDKCPHGLVVDTHHPCECCKKCGNGEYEFCDPSELNSDELAGRKNIFGRCGKGLVCRANYGVPLGGKPEMICYCQAEKMVCGSDGVTYETVCRLEKIAFQTGQNIRKQKRGMCREAPRVVTPPSDVTNSTVGNVCLQCEVKGNPVPRVEWRKLGPNGPGDFLPTGNSGSDRVAVQTRGGPEEYEVTGWLQISRLEVEDTGEYECVGINELGQDSGRGSISVVGGGAQTESTK